MTSTTAIFTAFSNATQVNDILKAWLSFWEDVFSETTSAVKCHTKVFGMMLMDLCLREELSMRNDLRNFRTN